MQRKSSLTLQPLKNNRSVFRRLYKNRKGHSLSQNNLTSTPNLRQPQTNTYEKQNNNSPLLNESKLIKNPQISDKITHALSQINFQHHNQQTCFCGNCTCGRHQCKLKTINPQFKNKSSYSVHYNKKILPINLKESLIVSKQSPPLKGNSLVNKSTYAQDFSPQKMSQTNLTKPNDHLKLSGPIQNITSYSNQFRNYGGINQYVKPTDRYTIGPFPFCNKTTYTKQFVSRKIKRSQSLKSNDMIKNGKMWLGKSVYSVNFMNPNEHEEVIKNPIMQKSGKLLKNPDFLSRFSTSYRRDFQKKQPTLCPIKKSIILQQQEQKKTVLLNLLNENADYRGLNPEFKSFSTSKQYNV